MLAALALMLVAAPMPGEEEAQRFKGLFEQAEAQFQQGDFGAAVALFREADRVRVTPEVAYDLAKCHEKLGDEAYALYYYRLYLRRAPDAPDTKDITQRVTASLTRAGGEGQGFLELDAPLASRVTVAGHVFPAPPVAMLLAPGAYEVTADFPSGARTMTVNVATGETTSVTFEPLLVPVVPVEQALSAELVAKGYEREPPHKPSTLRILSYVAAGIGAAALVTGVALGVSSNADASQLQSDRSLTVSQAEATATSANQKATVANVLFGVGGGAVLTAGVLFVFSLPEPGMKAEAR